MEFPPLRTSPGEYRRVIVARKPDQQSHTVAEDRCSCPERCPLPDCQHICLGGHSHYPDKHWCAALHQWNGQNRPAEA